MTNSSSCLRCSDAYSMADLYSPFRAINLTTFDPVSLSVCQECSPTCRASRPMINPRPFSFHSLPDIYGSFVAIDADPDIGRCPTFRCLTEERTRFVVLGSMIKKKKRKERIVERKKKKKGFLPLNFMYKRFGL